MKLPEYRGDGPAVRMNAGRRPQTDKLRDATASKSAVPTIESKYFDPGERIMAEGEEATQAWLIRGGVAVVTLRDGRKIPLGKGCIVGEMSLMDGGTRTASVHALNRVETAPISARVFREMLDKSPSLVRYLFETLISDLRRGYGLETRERVEGGPEYRSEAAADRVLRRTVVQPGHVFFRAGEPGEHLVLIQEGEIALSDAEGKRFATIGPGRVCGELALLNYKPRAATATALTSVTCEIVNAEELGRAIAKISPILRNLLYFYAREVDRLNAPRNDPE